MLRSVITEASLNLTTPGAITQGFGFPYRGKDKGKGHPVTGRGGPRVPDRLRPRIFMTFGTTRVVGEIH